MARRPRTRATAKSDGLHHKRPARGACHINECSVGSAQRGLQHLRDPHLDDVACLVSWTGPAELSTGDCPLDRPVLITSPASPRGMDSGTEVVHRGQPTR